jgi:hypothetical protein
MKAEDMAVIYGNKKIMESKDRNKEPFSRPTLTKLTPEQAKRLVVECNNCSEEEAAEFLESLRKQPPNAIRWTMP